MELPVLEAKKMIPHLSGPDERTNNIPVAEHPNGNEEQKPDDDDDDYEETYGDLEDGHDDLEDPESDRGVDNLE